MFLGLRTVIYHGGGIKVATVRDPFGNTLGLIENPHFAVTDSSASH